MAHRILLIDDEEAILKVLQMFLTRRNYVVDCARNLEEVEAHLGQNNYSVAITDLSLTRGEMEGLQVLECLARQPMKPKIVACSGYTTIDVAEKVLIMGADMFLPKPFGFKTLLKTLDDLLPETPTDRGFPLMGIKGTTTQPSMGA